MSKLLNTRLVRSLYPGNHIFSTIDKSILLVYLARLLIIDYGLNEKIIESICHGLDQLFSLITTYIGIEYVPMFGLIINGQNQSEVCLFEKLFFKKRRCNR